MNWVESSKISDGLKFELENPRMPRIQGSKAPRHDFLFNLSPVAGSLPFLSLTTAEPTRAPALEPATSPNAVWLSTVVRGPPLKQPYSFRPPNLRRRLLLPPFRRFHTQSTPWIRHRS